MRTPKVGALLRAYEVNPAKVPDRIAKLEKAIAALRPWVDQVRVLVWENTREYGKKCGALRADMLHGLGAEVTPLPHGEIFSDAGTTGAHLNLADGLSHSLMFSPEAVAYATPTTLARVMASVRAGAKAVGVEMRKELGNSVREGRFANTFCAWDNRALLEVGGFPWQARMPRDGQKPRICGVEEIIPLIRLVRKYGRCLHAICAKDGDTAAYDMGQPGTPEWDIQQQKFLTKDIRQFYMAWQERVTFEILRQAVELQLLSESEAVELQLWTGA